jgi:hypothetical protein
VHNRRWKGKLKDYLFRKVNKAKETKSSENNEKKGKGERENTQENKEKKKQRA